MLVLSRKIQESVLLPEQQVKITILRVQGRRVVLGISAPDGVEVHREETWERIVQREFATTVAGHAALTPE